MILICALCLLAGCGDKRTESVLDGIDTVINSRPDSALHILDSLKAEKDHWPKRLRMRHDLLTMKAQNKAYVDFTTDSVGRMLVEYYDSHGTANERVMAHYLLGCAYRDLDETPRAIDCFLDAVNTADTTSIDCDYLTISTAYSQMARLYGKQLLLTNEIEARRQASHYAMLANNIFYEIYNKNLSAAPYILMNKKDSAELILEETLYLFRKYGYPQYSFQSYFQLLHILVDQKGRLQDVKRIIDRVEAESDLFDEHHELPPSQRQYYYYKGKYYEGLSQLDSAELYYRKVYRPGMTAVQKNPMYQGLLSVFQKRQKSDSIAKYAHLYCEANDSSIALKDQDLTAQIAASYNYNHLQKQHAIDSQKIANSTIIISILLVLIAFGVIWWVKKRGEILEQQRRKQRDFDILKAEYTNVMEEYQRNMRTLQILDQSHQIVIDHLRDELSHYQEERQDYKNKYNKISQEVTEVTLRYETEKQCLQDANESLANRIKQFEQREDMAFHLKNTREFMNTEIAIRILKMPDNPLETMSETDWIQLSSTIGLYFPAMLQDLNNHLRKGRQKMKMCLLVIFDIRDSCISNLLGVSASRLSNMKSEVNHELFSDTSARTLQRNLRQKYNIILCQ